MKKILFLSLAIILTLSLIFTTAPFKPAQAATTWYVNPGEESIQTAIDNANDYDTIIVNPGIYKEWLTINKPLTLQGLDKDTTRLYGSALSTKPAIEIKNTSDVNISNLTISGNVTIGNLKTGGYGRGVRLENANNCTITNNNFLDIKGLSPTDYCGLETSSANGTTITNNTFENNEFGIFLRNNSTANRIENNVILGNGIGMRINHSIDNWLEDNSVSNSDSHGIYLDYSANGTTITGNSIFNNAGGIYLWILCNQNNIIDNSIYDNEFNGVSIINQSDENNIDKNDIDNNGRFGVFINLYSANNIVSGNIIHYNDSHGIYLAYASTGTDIYHNSIEYNDGCGIRIFNAHYTTVYNNNFINNSPQAYVYSGASPVFNLDPPIGGNHWSDWTTPDVDPVDGFVDNPYVFGGGRDDWPWAEKDGWALNEPPVADAGPDQTVDATTIDGANVILDGSGSSDPDDDSLIYNWSWDGGTANGVSPTISLPRGTTTVTLVVNDGTEDSAPDTVEIAVVASVTGLAALVEQMFDEGWIDDPDIRDSLLDKINAATNKINQGKTKPAENILNAFINHINAQTDKHISPEAAEILIADAEDIIANL